MKYIILNPYFDKGLDKEIKAGDVLELDEDRVEVLKSIGVTVKEYDEDDNSNDDNSDEDDNSDLIEAYKNDKNIVDGLLAPDLKILCEAFEVNYTNVAEAKEALKILTIG